jgi:hypothetical protein
MTHRHTRYGFLAVCSIALAAFSIGTTGCSQTEPEIEYLTFEIDNSLLTDPRPVPGTGIIYSPPADWISIPPEDISSAEDLTRLIGTRDSIDITEAYFEPESQSFLAITRLKQEADAKYLSRLEALYDSGPNPDSDVTLNRTQFRTDHFLVHQFLVQSSRSVILRFVFIPEDPPATEAVFILSRDGYADIVRTVESVAGSFREQR